MTEKNVGIPLKFAPLYFGKPATVLEYLALCHQGYGGAKGKAEKRQYLAWLKRFNPALHKAVHKAVTAAVKIGAGG